MKLVEALEVIRRTSTRETEPFRVALCTGFTALHLETFLTAHLKMALNGRPVHLITGLYGDLTGTTKGAIQSDAEALVIILEWPDLDPRLGIRRLGGWLASDHANVLEHCKHTLARLEALVVHGAQSRPVVFLLPTLPFPLISYTPDRKADRLRLDIDALISAFAARIAAAPLLHVASMENLARRSPLEQRFDVASEIAAGYPYKNIHSDVLSEVVSEFLAPAEPKKGLITDLDDTLWAGILGEVGANSIGWDLESSAQIHGLYQQVLASLAETGVLLAIASKNEPSRVEEALNRPDLILKKNSIFPIAASWGPKSSAVSEILNAWNISADTVVFVDDSPLELAEVKAAHPEIECLLFQSDDPASVWQLLKNLRNQFGKSHITSDDAIRAESLRTSAQFLQNSENSGSPERLLESIEQTVKFSFRKDPPDPRALELINKTNQFNLNGQRFTETDWHSYLRSTETFIQTVAYQDKFGPIGKVAVLAGRLHDHRSITLDSWVMSCRAFSRRIEHTSLKSLFDRFDVDEIFFGFRSTTRNIPWQKFFKELTGREPAPMCKLEREDFVARCPKLHHKIEEALV